MAAKDRNRRARAGVAWALRAAALCLLTGLAACAAQYNFTTSEAVIDAPRVASASSYALTAADGRAGAADEEILAALDKELMARGWTPALSADADVLVGYSLEQRAGSSQVSDGFLGLYSTVNAAATRELAYLEQTLVIDFTSGPTGEEMWRGWAAARFYAPPGEERGEMINQAVASILAQLDD